MIITILEALVDAGNWSALQHEFKERVVELPPQMLQTFLMQDASNPASWRIVSVWKSREALEEMRNSAETPAGMVMFRNAGAEPKLSIFNVPVAAP